MAEVFPFQGVLYNPDIIADMADVVAPPYDVISPSEQEGFYQRHPYNVIRLILGQPQAGDTGQHDIHNRASGYFYQWLEEKILVRDAAPSFYLTSVSFMVGDQNITRYGVIGAVRLEHFDKGVILPHERTFSKVKSERLNLMQVCHTNFSPIFGLYPDGNGILDKLKAHGEQNRPDMDLVDSKGMRQKLWRIVDAQTQAHVTASLEGQCIYIADGHHRYETALNYRDWVKENTPGFDENHPANFVMMSLSSLEDPGMVIFPAHRLLKQVSPAEVDSLMSKISTYFDIQTFPTDAGLDAALIEFDRALEAHADRNAIGLCLKNQSALQVMVLKEGVMAQLFGSEIPEALRDLDVTVLTRLVLMELLGFDQARLDDATKFGYATNSEAAVAAVRDGDADVALILNPTKIGQVQRVAEEGLIMPRKSTYFYPKVSSGQVFNLLK